VCNTGTSLRTFHTDKIGGVPRYESPHHHTGLRHQDQLHSLKWSLRAYSNFAYRQKLQNVERFPTTPLLVKRS
jgi:hypothetical protein